MKFHLSLLSALAALTNAFPTMPSNDFGRVENRAELSAAALGHSGAHVVRESSHLDKRLSPICSVACGIVKASDCLVTLAAASGLAKSNPKGSLCSVNDILFLGSGCQITFEGFITKTTCISNARFSGLAEEIFKDCVTNPLVGVGGCVDLGDGGHVCIADEGKIDQCSVSS